jgi:hypothetical protein
MIKLTPAQTIPERLQRRGSVEGVEMREGEGSKTTFPCENANRHLQTLRVRSVSQFHARSQNISSLRVCERDFCTASTSANRQQKAALVKTFTACFSTVTKTGS